MAEEKGLESGQDRNTPDLPPGAPTFERAASRFPHTHGISYRPEVDGLRAIAVGSVILYHAGVWPFTGGYVGVDIFFVISGYLISSIILGDIAGNGFSFTSFYERRIKRIFPALFAVLAFSTVAAVISFTPLQLREFGQALAATTIFASNIYFRLKAGYFSADTENNPLIHMWSLSVEEQFYLLFPILLIIFQRSVRRRLNLAIVAALILSLGWSLYQEHHGDAMANFFLPQTRAWELLAGALVAINRARWQNIAARYRIAAMGVEISGALLMLIPIITLSATSSWPGINTIPVVAGAALLILAANTRSPVGRLLAMPPMVWVGLISYSAYLWHQPLFAFGHIVRPRFSGLETAGAIVATFGIAWLSWRFIERPFRKPGNYRRITLFACSAALTFAFAAIGLALHLTNGLPQRFAPATLALADTAAPSPKRAHCHAEGADYLQPKDACRYFNPRVTWAVLGDSHAIETGQALAEELRARDEGIVQLTFSGCQPALIFVSENPGCTSWLNDAVSLIEREKDIHDVLLVFRHPFYLYGDQKRTYPEPPRDRPNFLLNLPPDAARARYWQSYEALVRRLLVAGKRVHIVAPIPELPVPIDRYVFGAKPGDQGITRRFYAQRNGEILQHLQKIAHWPGVSLSDPVTALCDAENCHAIVDGKAMYFDDNHLSMAGARRFIATQRRAGLLP